MSILVPAAAGCGDRPPMAPRPDVPTAPSAPVSAPSTHPSSTMAVPEEDEPERLELVSIDDWFGDVGYVTVRARPSMKKWMVKIRYDAATDTAVGIRAMHGGVHLASHPPRARGHLVTRNADGLLLYPSETAAPVAIPGERAWFTEGGTELITAEARAVNVIDPSDGSVLRRTVVAHDILEGEVVDNHFISVCDGSCPEGTGALRVDLEHGTVVLDEETLVSVRSPSGRHVAALVNDIASTGHVIMVALVWDELGRLRRIPLGPWPQRAVTLELDRTEANLVVSYDGLSGVNMYTAREPFASLSLATGTRGPAPDPSTLWPEDIVERWERVEKRLAPLAQSPRTLVPTRRGPGRVTAFAESDDQRTAVVLEGDVEDRWGGVNVKQPQLLVIDDLQRVRHRVPLPLQADETIVNGRTELSGDERIAWLCYEIGEETALFLVELETGQLVELPTESCWSHDTSSDGMALLQEPYIVDLTNQRRFEVSLEGMPPPPPPLIAE